MKKIVSKTRLPFLISVVAIFSFTFMVQSQDQGDLVLNEEFPTKQQEAHEQFYNTLNCFYKNTVWHTMDRYKKKFEKDAPLAPVPFEVPSYTCPELGPIGQYYRDQLNGMLGVIDDNLEALAKGGSIDSAETPPDTVNICNLDLRAEEQVTETSPSGGDYFSFEKQSTFTPTYAYQIVSNCYRGVYMAHLQQRGIAAFDPQDILEEKKEGDQASFMTVYAQEDNAERESLFLEDIRQVRTARVDLYEQEIERSRRMIDLSSATMSEFMETFPQHVRYEQLKHHSKKWRDQLRRIRVSVEALEKLINSSTRNCSS